MPSGTRPASRRRSPSSTRPGTRPESAPRTARTRRMSAYPRPRRGTGRARCRRRRPRCTVAFRRPRRSRRCSYASPPLALESKLGAASAVELVEPRQVLVSQLEVEDLAVLGDALAVRRLQDRWYLALDAPADEHLCRCPPESFRDLRHGLARDVAPVAQGAVGLEHDAAPLARVEECLAVLVRAELHLV